MFGYKLLTLLSEPDRKSEQKFDQKSKWKVQLKLFVSSPHLSLITWGLFEVGESIIAWLDYQINGTEIPSNLEIVGHPLSLTCHPDKVDHINSILVHLMFLQGIVTETTQPMFAWTALYNMFIFVGSIYR